MCKTGILQYYKLTTMKDMIVLLYPSNSQPNVVPEFDHNGPLSSIYEEYSNWSNVMQIESIGHLNSINRSERFKSYVQICESRQNQMMAKVCQLISRGHKSLSGPMTIHDALNQN